MVRKRKRPAADEDSDFEPPKAKRARRARKNKPAKKPKKVAKKRAKKKPAPGCSKKAVAQMDSDDDLVVMKPAKKTKRARAAKSLGGSKKQVKASVAKKRTKGKAKAKRKKAAASLPASHDCEEKSPEQPTKKRGKKKKAKKLPKPKEEKRLARFRGAPPGKTLDRISRAARQRMYMVDAEILGEFHRRYAMLGSTGNVYHIDIKHELECTCPDFIKGNCPCKHICFVFLKALKMDRHSPHVYQRALLTEELKEIFAKAPDRGLGRIKVAKEISKAYRKSQGMEDSGEEDAEEEEVEDKNRKEFEGNDCPICMEELEEKDRGKIDWCRTCGNNVHKDCIGQWIRNESRQGKDPTCPFCRDPWSGDTVVKKGKGKKLSGGFNREGYQNFGDEMGMSQRRDTSSYSSWYGYHKRKSYWGRRRRW